MNMRQVVPLAVGCALACLTCREAFAVKFAAKISPQNAADAGFSLTVWPKNEDGTTTFIIARDLSKAKTIDPDSELTIRREAMLRADDDAGRTVASRLEPTLERNVLTYRVTLPHDRLARARVTISERDDYKNLDGRPSLIGGGTLYEIALDKFTGKAPTAEARPTKSFDLSAWMNALRSSR